MKRPGVHSVAIEPRNAVTAMRPYKPPLEGRWGKLRLDFNENPMGCSPAVRRALARLGSTAISAYPEQETARREIAKYFGVAPEEMLFTNGTDEGLNLVVGTYVQPGQSVLIVEPTFAMYRFYSELAGARIATVRYDAEMRFPTEGVRAALRKSPRVFFLANPNNPTGTLVSPAVLRSFLHAAPRTILVVDEAYFDFCGVTVIPWIRRYKNLVVTRTFSKAFGLAGMRLGCVFVHRDVATIMRKAQSPYPVSAAALMAAAAAVRDRAFLRRSLRELRRGQVVLEKSLAALQLPFFPTAANFVLVNFGSGMKEIVAELSRRGILIRDRASDFDGAGYARITFGTPSQMRRLLAELKRVLRTVA
jgi:histidinol-phosphate aminotransferase